MFSLGRVSREKFKVFEGVFDEQTLHCLEILKRKKYYDELGKPIKTGKEGDVYHAYKNRFENDHKDEATTHLAIKMFRVTSANFKKISDYIVRDFRFRTIKGNLRKVIMMWSQKEFRNLQLLHQAHVNVPYAYKQYQNIIIMDYVSGGMLKDVFLEDPQEIFLQCKEQMYTMLHHAKLIHGDLSEFNIMLTDDNIVTIIDVGQAMGFKSQEDFKEFEDLFQRDVKNVCYFFTKKYGLEINYEKICEELKEGLFD